MKFVNIGIFLLLVGCTSITPPDDFVYKEIPTSTFKFATWQKITNPSAPVKVYIEGDGAAFRADGRISSDPTPRSTLVRELAFGDNHENVVYMARACQFVKDEMCAPKYWSDARFAPEIITAQYQALKQTAHDRPLILVGFSGGAQVAGLLAVKYSDLRIKKIITIAGNLDHKAWTDYHNLPPLLQSLDLKQYQKQYALLAQIHYVGEQDDNIIPELTTNFVANKNSIIYVKKANHNRGWQSVYEKIRAE